jgi:hypothetical protein
MVRSKIDDTEQRQQRKWREGRLFANLSLWRQVWYSTLINDCRGMHVTQSKWVMSSLITSNQHQRSTSTLPFRTLKNVIFMTRHHHHDHQLVMQMDVRPLHAPGHVAIDDKPVGGVPYLQGCSARLQACLENVGRLLQA